MTAACKIRAAAAAALALAASACGGGGGSGIAFLPSPPVLPPPQPAAGSFSSTYASQVSGARFAATIDPATGATSNVSILAPAAYGAIQVQENRGEYAVWSGHSAWDYDFPIFQTEHIGAHPTAGDETGNFDYYRFAWDGGSSELQLLKKSPANSRIQLTHLSYGLYMSPSAAHFTNQLETGVFVFGAETAAGDMPRTGSGSYTGIVDGYASVGGIAYRLLGSTGSLDANFATGGIATTLALQGNRDFLTGTLGAVTQFGTVTGTGAITSGTSRYSGTLSGLGMAGPFAGGFFGPTASETGFSFSLSGGNDAMTGVFVGKK